MRTLLGGTLAGLAGVMVGIGLSVVLGAILREDLWRRAFIASVVSIIFTFVLGLVLANILAALFGLVVWLFLSAISAFLINLSYKQMTGEK